MPLDVRVFEQPHRFGCLPTCVQAVRHFYADPITYDQASEECNEIPGSGGCIWEDTIAALSANYEVQEIEAADDDVTYAYNILQAKVDIDQTPVICHLGWGFDRSEKHAVVVVSVTVTEVEIMNPAPPGGHLETMPRSEFTARWQALDFGAFWFEE